LLEDLGGGGQSYTSADGVDCRNYGGGAGLVELREMFAPLLSVPVGQLVAGNNSSLALMHDCIVYAMLGAMPGGGHWVRGDTAFLCPVPGYDRHFALCEQYGIEMIPVPMTEMGPDMDKVEELVSRDARIKGMWCVPKFSNPGGECYSDVTVARLAVMETAAADFRIFWDNAYAVHDFSVEVGVADLLKACAEAGWPERAFVFGSTSKITFAGGGVAFLGGSEANVRWYLDKAAKRSIGPDKLNQLRHARFLGSTAGVKALMARQAEIVRPKFELVQRVLGEELGALDTVSWPEPKGGYFVTLEVRSGLAKHVVGLAGMAGLMLTPAGATHPHGVDPADRVIRIAPTYPTLAELEVAMEGLCICARLAEAEVGRG